MQTRTAAALAVLAAVAALLFAAPAQARTWTMDNFHSQAVFEIRHISGKVTGWFNSFEGAVTDPDSPDTGAIAITIDVGSVTTGVAQRDAHLKTADFFDAARFPVMRFVSERIEALGDDWYEAHGTLTIKDVSRPVVLPYRLYEQRPSPLEETRCFDVRGVQADYALNRLDFGVGDGRFAKLGIVGESVAITINAELISRRPGCE